MAAYPSSAHPPIHAAHPSPSPTPLPVLSPANPLISLTYPQDPLPPPLSAHPLASFPTPQSLTDLLTAYLTSLHPSKRAKALLSRSFLHLIHAILASPQSTSISDAQTRFWARRQFSLLPAPAPPHDLRVCHHASSLPLAPAEQIWRIVTEAHARVGHVGRDRTVREVQKEWAGVPKEVVGRYVKACPGCRGVRKVGGVRTSPRRRTRELLREDMDGEQEEDELDDEDGPPMGEDAYVPKGVGVNITAPTPSLSGSAYGYAHQHPHAYAYAAQPTPPQQPPPQPYLSYPPNPSHLHPFSPAPGTKPLLAHSQAPAYGAYGQAYAQPALRPSPSPSVSPRVSERSSASGGAQGSRHSADGSGNASGSGAGKGSGSAHGNSPLDILAAVAATENEPRSPLLHRERERERERQLQLQQQKPQPPPTLPFTSSLASLSSGSGPEYRMGMGMGMGRHGAVRRDMASDVDVDVDMDRDIDMDMDSALPNKASTNAGTHTTPAYSTGVGPGPSIPRLSAGPSQPPTAVSPAPASPTAPIRLPHFFQLLPAHIRTPSDPPPPLRSPPYGRTVLPSLPSLNLPHGPSPSAHKRPAAESSGRVGLPAHLRERMGEEWEKERVGRERWEGERKRRERAALGAAAREGHAPGAAAGAAEGGAPPAAESGNAKGKRREESPVPVPAPVRGPTPAVPTPTPTLHARAGMDSISSAGGSVSSAARGASASASASASTSTGSGAGAGSASASGGGRQWASCNPLLPRNEWTPLDGEE